MIVGIVSLPLMPVVTSAPTTTLTSLLHLVSCLQNQLPVCGGWRRTAVAFRLGMCADLIRLSLRRPKGWGFALTASSSSPEVRIPRVEVVDSRSGVLLGAVGRSMSSVSVPGVTNVGRVGSPPCKKRAKRKRKEKRKSTSAGKHGNFASCWPIYYSTP